MLIRSREYDAVPNLHSRSFRRVRECSTARLQMRVVSPGPSASGLGITNDIRWLAERVRGEFREMPELRLTLTQAQRLLGMEPARCQLVLNLLVNSGVLTCTRSLVYGLRTIQP